MVRLERLGARLRLLDPVERLVVASREQLVEIDAVGLAVAQRLDALPDQSAQGHEADERECADDQVEDVHARVPSRVPVPWSRATAARPREGAIRARPCGRACALRVR